MLYKKILLFFSLFSLLCITQTPAAQTDSPVECLKQISAAVDNADSETFSSLVDLDSVLNGSLDAFLLEAQKPENASAIPPLLAIVLSQAAQKSNTGAGLRTLLVNEARTFVLNGIDSGAFAGKKPDTSRLQGMLAPLFANASMGRKQIHNIGDPEPVENGWLLPFWVYDFGNGQEYPVTGRFAAGDSGCRLVAVENLGQLIKQIREEMGTN